MKKENINDQKLKKARLKRFVWYGIVLFGILTIVLCLFSLFYGLHFIFPLICFLVETYLRKWYDKIK
ncbi:MAG: hypothetical protein PUB18_06485 [bacterium]|nr:hypothetical protein [bacterium]